MPRGQRARIRQQAQTLRAIGESVILLIAQESAPTTNLPIDLVKAQIPPKRTTDTQFATYAKVSYHKLETLTYAEPGKIGYLAATLEFPFEIGPKLKLCYAAQLADGSIVMKKSLQVSEGRESYIMECEGYENTLQ